MNWKYNAVAGLLLTLSAAAALAAEPAAIAGTPRLGATNLVANGSFELLRTTGPRDPRREHEEAKPFQDWDAAGAWMYGGVDIGRVARTGNFSAFISGGWLQRGVKVEEGKIYRISCWVKTAFPDVPEETKTGAYLKVEYGDWYWERWAAGIAGWRCLDMLIRIPEKTQWLTLKLGVDGLRGWCWFDDVEVVELPEAPTPGERRNDMQPVPRIPS